MRLDCRDYPADYTFAEVVGRELGAYVNVAEFLETSGRRMFRLIMDSQVDRRQLRELFFSVFQDQHGSYEFSHIEAIQGPIMDAVGHRSATTQYLRVTFL